MILNYLKTFHYFSNAVTAYKIISTISINVVYA